jgi:hypothetical protein
MITTLRTTVHIGAKFERKSNATCINGPYVHVTLIFSMEVKCNFVKYFIYKVYNIVSSRPVTKRGEHGKKQHGGQDQCLLRTSTTPLYKTSLSVFAGVSRRWRPPAESNLPDNQHSAALPPANLIPNSAFKISETPSRDTDDTDRRDPRATASLRLHACDVTGAGSPNHSSPVPRQNSVGARYQAMHGGAPHRALCALRLASGSIAVDKIRWGRGVCAVCA